MATRGRTRPAALVSVLVAFAIGIRELLSLSGFDLTMRGKVYGYLDENLGFVIVGVFAVGWLLSAIIYRLRRVETVS